MSTSRNVMQEVSPKLAELTSEMLFGDVWERPELSKRDRSLILHSTMYAGGPVGANAVRIAKEVFEERGI